MFNTITFYFKDLFKISVFIGFSVLPIIGLVSFACLVQWRHWNFVLGCNSIALYLSCLEGLMQYLLIILCLMEMTAQARLELTPSH